MLNAIKQEQSEKIDEAGRVIGECILRGGVIHIFGTGHSHMLAEEAYARAGGLFAIDPILEPSLMLHEGYSKSSALERLPGLARAILETHTCDIRPEDVAVICSNSGRNPCPVEMAMLFKEKGARVIAITSLSHANSVSSRDPTGRKLHEVADIVLDNMGIAGDAALEFPGLPVRACPTSTAIAVVMLWSIVASAIDYLLNHGYAPPVMMSGNLDASVEWAKQIEPEVRQKYAERLPWLKTLNHR